MNIQIEIEIEIYKYFIQMIIHYIVITFYAMVASLRQSISGKWYVK